MTTPGIIVKVALGAGDAAPRRVAALNLRLIDNENNLTAAMIDTQTKHAWFAANSSPNQQLVKIALGAGDAAPTRLSALSLGRSRRRAFLRGD